MKKPKFKVGDLAMFWNLNVEHPWNEAQPVLIIERNEEKFESILANEPTRFMMRESQYDYKVLLSETARVIKVYYYELRKPRVSK